MLETAHLIDRIERYYDLVPRATARVEEHGPFTLFVADGPGGGYARPRLGGHPTVATSEDVAAVRARQRELGVPEQFEWIDELAPALAALGDGAGFEVRRHPLLVLDREPGHPPLEGADVHVAAETDPAIPLARAAISAGFAAGTSADATAGLAERDAKLATADEGGARRTREQIAAGQIVMAIATAAGEPVGGGSAYPRGEVAELMGIATLPAYRRRGLGLAITAADEAAARLYERIGYRPLATACIAVPAS